MEKYFNSLFSYCSLMLCQNLTNSNFLKVNCNVESKTIGMNFVYSVTLKSGLSYTLIASFTTINEFVTCINHL